MNSQSYGHWNVKNGSFFVFSADGSKKSVIVLANYLNASEWSYWVLSENGMIHRLWSYLSWDIEGRNIIKNCRVGKNYRNPVFSRVHYATDNPEANILRHFLKDLKKIFQIHVNISPKLWLIFCCHLQKTQQMSNFWHSNNYNSMGKNDNELTNNPIFIIYYLSSIFQFWISRPSKFSPTGNPFFEIQSPSPFLLFFFWVKFTCTCQKWHF